MPLLGSSHLDGMMFMWSLGRVTSTIATAKAFLEYWFIHIYGMHVYLYIYISLSLSPPHSLSLSLCLLLYLYTNLFICLHRISLQGSFQNQRHLKCSQNNRIPHTRTPEKDPACFFRNFHMPKWASVQDLELVDMSCHVYVHMYFV